MNPIEEKAGLEYYNNYVSCDCEITTSKELKLKGEFVAYSPSQKKFLFRDVKKANNAVFGKGPSECVLIISENDLKSLVFPEKNEQRKKYGPFVDTFSDRSFNRLSSSGKGNPLAVDFSETWGGSSSDYNGARTLNDIDTGSFNQFEANYEKFNIKSEFNENEYNTSINFKSLSAEEIRRAQEIGEVISRDEEKRATSSNNLDEESLYSMVLPENTQVNPSSPVGLPTTAIPHLPTMSSGKASTSTDTAHSADAHSANSQSGTVKSLFGRPEETLAPPSVAPHISPPLPFNTPGVSNKPHHKGVSNTRDIHDIKSNHQMRQQQLNVIASQPTQYSPSLVSRTLPLQPPLPPSQPSPSSPYSGMAPRFPVGSPVDNIPKPPAPLSAPSGAAIPSNTPAPTSDSSHTSGSTGNRFMQFRSAEEFTPKTVPPAQVLPVPVPPIQTFPPTMYYFPQHGVSSYPVLMPFNTPMFPAVPMYPPIAPTPFPAPTMNMTKKTQN